MNILIIAIIVVIISIILILHLYRLFKFEKNYSKEKYEDLLQRINDLESNTRSIENEREVDKKILTSLLTFLEDKETYRVCKIEKQTNLGDTALIGTRSKGHEILYEVYSLNFGGIVSYCTVTEDGLLDLYSKPYNDSILLREKNDNAYFSLGFGRALMDRIIEYSKSAGIKKLYGDMMMTDCPEHDERMQKFYLEKYKFENPSNRKIIKYL